MLECPALTEPLYTTEILRLAASLDEPQALGREDGRAELRSPTCGSRISLAVQLDNERRIERLSMQVHACAFGQASASLLTVGLGAVPGCKPKADEETLRRLSDANDKVVACKRELDDSKKEIASLAEKAGMVKSARPASAQAAVEARKVRRSSIGVSLKLAQR